MSWRPARLAMSPMWMRAAIAPALAFIAIATDHSYLYDFWHHLARGQVMVGKGELVNHELFSCTIPGQPIQDLCWLAQIFYARAFALGGLPLIQLLNSLAIALAIAVFVHVIRRQTGSMGLAAAAGVFAFFGIWQSLTVRPQTFSLLLFVILYELLDAAEQRPWLLILSPFVLALWVNLHGAFVAGLILIGCFAGGLSWNAWRQRNGARDVRIWIWWLAVFACVAATLVNPYRWGAYYYVSQTSRAATSRPISEWLPPSLDLWVGKFWVASLVLLVLALAAPRPRPMARDILLILCFLPLACGSVRMIVWWVLVVTPFLARVLAANLPASAAEEEPARGPAICFTAIVAVAIFSAPGLERFNPLLSPARRGERQTDRALREIASYLAEREPSGAVFCRFEWGAFITCAIGPTYPVFMDGRIEIFPDRVWNEYAQVTGGQLDWQSILDRYHVHYLILDTTYHSDSGLLDRVKSSPNWRQACEADQAVLFVRPQN